MLAAERRSRIVSEVRRTGAAGVPDLAAALGVSEMTVRRDIDVLAEQGVIDRVRGGATAPRLPDRPEVDFASQSLLRRDEKHAIARVAAGLVEPGMAIGISGGTTAWALAQALRSIPDLTIVTNSLPVADVFARPERADEPYTQTVVLTGGVRTPADALVGPIAVRALEVLHCDLVFLGVRGVDVQAGLTTSNLLEAETDRALIATGSTSIVLADHSKWGAVGLTTIADVDQIDRLIMDAGLADAAAAQLSEHVELVLAPVADS